MSLNFLLGYHRRAVVRPCGLFRPRRLWRGHDHQVSRAEHAGLGIVVGTLVGTARRRYHRPADHSAARRLFRDGDHRLRPGLLFHRLPLELGDRRRRRPDRLAPRSRSILASPPLDILRQRRRVLLSRPCRLRPRGRRDGVATALAVRPHLACDPRERAARALPRHPRRPAYLAVLGDFLRLRQRSPARSTRCSTISSIRARCAGTSPAIS